VAEIAVKESEEVSRLDGETLKASADLMEKELGLKRSILEDLKKKKAGDVEQKKAELEVKKAQQRLSQVTRDRETLEKDTIPRQTNELQVNVQQALAVESGRKEALDLAMATAEKTRKQIALCKVLAPAAGRVELSRRRVPGIPEGGPPIEEGRSVRNRQLLLRIHPERPAPK
jgi:hypothetical protein